MFPPFCSSSCEADLSLLIEEGAQRSDPSENAFIIEPSYRNVLIGHGQDPFYNIGDITIKNT